MKYRAKRVIALLLALCVAVGMLPVDSYKAETTPRYEYEDDFSVDTSDNYESSGVAFDIKDGVLTIDGDGVVGLSDQIWYNATYEFDIDISDKSEWAGVMFDKETPTAQRDDAGYMLYIRKNGSVELYTGASKVIKSVSVDLSTSKKVHFKIVTEEGKITVYANNSSDALMVVEDDSFEFGYFSMVGYSGGKVSYDNLKITADKGDGEIKKIQVTVPDEAKSLGVGETIHLDITTLPFGADATDLEWKITDVYGNPSTVATVNEDGYLTAGNATGTIKVTAVSKTNSEIKDSVELVVVSEPTLEYEVTGDSNGGQTEFIYDFTKDDKAFAGQNVTVSVTDGKMSIYKNGFGNGIAKLSGKKFGAGVYEFDMNVNDLGDWASILFCKTNESDIWDNSGYMFLVQPNGAYQLIKAGNGAVKSGNISGFTNTMNHYKIVKTDDKIEVFFNNATTPLVTYEDSTYKEGYVSFGVSGPNGGTGYIDNVTININKATSDNKNEKFNDLYIVGQYGTNVLQVGKDLPMSVHCEPYIDTKDLITWSVSDESIATIDSANGIITAVKAGMVTVTATADDGTTATTDILVQDKVETTAINVAAVKNQRIMGIGKSVQMNAYVYPYMSGDTEVVWTVAGTDGKATTLATITEDGVLTSSAKGFVRVRAALASNTNIYSEWIMQIGAITKNGNVDMASMKTSFFAHYVADLTTDVDGNVVTDPNVLANEFDAEAYADKMAAMGVEYVVFTAWHYRMVVLGPSQAMIDWDMADHQTERDMLGDMIDAVTEKGINVVLYTHPYDGYDFKTVEEGLKTGWGSALKPEMAPFYDKDFDYDKWNDFLNDVYGELIDRYGDRISGIWCDEGNIGGGMAKAVDFPRLLETIKSKNPNICTIQNEHGYLYGFQYVTQEDWELAGFGDKTGETMQTYANHIPNPIISPDWWTTRALGTENACKFDGSVIFKYQVLQSGVIGSDCGIQWSAGPYPGEGCYYEAGVVESMEAMNAYLNPIAWTIKDTLASTSYTTMGGKTLQTVGWGIATKSVDDTVEYIHVLNPDDMAINGNTITLKAPKDDKIFESAYLVINNKEVTLVQTDSSVVLTLPEGETWNEFDTVIGLIVDEEATKENQESNGYEEETETPTGEGETSTEEGTSPETSDVATRIFVIVMIAAMAAAAVLVNTKYRKKYNEEV